MNFSQDQYRENIGKSELIAARTRAYFKQRFQQQAFAKLAKAFADRAEEFGVTKSGIAGLLGRDKAQVNRLLAHPSNMTFDTYAELALALNLEPKVLFEDLCEDARHNYQHEAYQWHRQGAASAPEVPVSNRAIQTIDLPVWESLNE